MMIWFIRWYSRIESETDLETIKQSYANTIRQLTEELNAIKQVNGKMC